MAKIDLDKLQARSGSIYPGNLAGQMDGRTSLRAGDAGGLTQFGANIIILAPGAKSSLRHWHLNEDEFVMVTQGRVMLHMDAGEEEMTVGECAAFPAGVADGHCFINQSDEEARFLVIGTRAPHEVATYSDIDMKVVLGEGNPVFTRHDGTPLPDDI
ncbi:cupin domain-containing protein [Falsihalocynthiibacter arcticus]|uniref:Transcriptional regulator n=1 Tax=Falsihalocynthiibacter arcticus TaxID=1579316 RepID=A0A126UVW8_9RHOB|nr:cupin domain-containing protein [Falsihalocynthiibacter arcticus]AML50221.1 transcriptional regulator [Falsihalocynthiibacter arcticus]